MPSEVFAQNEGLAKAVHLEKEIDQMVFINAVANHRS